MKRRIIYTLIVLSTGAFLWMSNSGGRATVAGEGNTGAPGENGTTCATCHSSGGGTVTLSIEVLDASGEAVSDYRPGETHTVTVSLSSSGSPSAYGFQAVALLNSNDSNAGSITSGSNSQTGTVNSRTYVEQAGPSSSSDFSFTWTAPAAGSGSVTFYASGNAVDGDGSTGGDGADVSFVTLNEGFNTSLTELENEAGFSIFPNPVQGDLNVRPAEGTSGLYQAMITDMAGRQIRSTTVDFNAGTATLSVSDLPEGNYNLTINNGDKTGTSRFIKL